MATDGSGIGVRQTTLWKRLNERGDLTATDKKWETLKVRRTIEGVKRPVIQMRAAKHTGSLPETPDKPDKPDTARSDTAAVGFLKALVSGFGDDARKTRHRET
jgi:hypothetical protein